MKSSPRPARPFVTRFAGALALLVGFVSLDACGSSAEDEPASDDGGADGDANGATRDSGSEDDANASDDGSDGASDAGDSGSEDDASASDDGGSEDDADASDAGADGASDGASDAGSDGGGGVPCDEGHWDDDGDPGTACVAWTVCPAGTHVSAPGSDVSDRTCAPCEAGTYCAGGAAPKIVCPDGTWDHDGSAATACVEARPVALAAGATSTCARFDDGTVRCWGGNQYGQLGDGTTTDRSQPVKVVGLSGAVELTVAGVHACVRFADGALRCWGRNAQGQIGDGTTEDRLVPTAVIALPPASQVVAGRAHTCALVSGSVRCWGNNDAGEIGDGTATNRLTPTATVPALSGVAELAGHGVHTCARLANGNVRCWGYNLDGQIGDGTASNFRTSPTLVTNLDGSALSGVAELGGGYHSCARLTDGTLWCWGLNSYGQLGDGTTIKRTSPVKILSGVVALDVGTNHTFARSADGTIRAWGNNQYGQLGDGTTVNRTSPTSVPFVTDSGFVEVVGGNEHSCGRRANGSVACWGRNYRGQLGDGTTDDAPAPTAVRW